MWRTSASPEANADAKSFTSLKNWTGQARTLGVPFSINNKKKLCKPIHFQPSNLCLGLLEEAFNRKELSGMFSESN
jgi:hypothetical protein